MATDLVELNMEIVLQFGITRCRDDQDVPRVGHRHHGAHQVRQDQSLQILAVLSLEIVEAIAEENGRRTASELIENTMKTSGD